MLQALARIWPKARIWLSVFAALTLAACGGAGPEGPKPGSEAEIAALTRGLMALGDGVDPQEAVRAARVTFETTHRLAIEYQITDGPLVHNSKVNAGIKPRGLCWHWAADMEARLLQENFQTLQLHRAIANADNLRLEHSTAILSRAGDPMQAGIVIDPWRKGGVLFWAPLREDTRYDWVPRLEVLSARAARSAAQ